MPLLDSRHRTGLFEAGTKGCEGRDAPALERQEEKSPRRKIRRGWQRYLRVHRPLIPWSVMVHLVRSASPGGGTGTHPPPSSCSAARADRLTHPSRVSPFVPGRERSDAPRVYHQASALGPRVSAAALAPLRTRSIRRAAFAPSPAPALDKGATMMMMNMAMMTMTMTMMSSGLRW